MPWASFTACNAKVTIHRDEYGLTEVIKLTPEIQEDETVDVADRRLHRTARNEGDRPGAFFKRPVAAADPDRQARMTENAVRSRDERLPRPAYARLALSIALALYGLPLMRHPESGSFLDGIDLAIHETGHLVFGPFGEVIAVAGGTLFQLIVPAVFVWYFVRRGDRHAATVPLWWIAQNLWNISVYVRDARVQELPLVGGGEHDWAFLLGRFGMLAHDQGIGRTVQAIGVGVCLVAVASGIRFAFVTEQTE